MKSIAAIKPAQEGCTSLAPRSPHPRQPPIRAGLQPVRPTLSAMWRSCVQAAPSWFSFRSLLTSSIKKTRMHSVQSQASDMCVGACATVVGRPSHRPTLLSGTVSASLSKLSPRLRSSLFGITALASAFPPSSLISLLSRHHH